MNRFLILILALAALLRFYKLESFPVSIYWDETAIGYNAYSIAQTGRDEYGVKFPLLFKSFNDYKLPGYIYTDAIFAKFFGLSIFTTRLPSALFGTFSVLTIYLIAKELFLANTPGVGKETDVRSQLSSVSTLAALMLAISPWHLQFSRAAYEASVAFTIILFGTTMLLYGLRSKIWAILSMPILALSFYFYLSARFVIPLILLAFFAIYRKEILKNIHSYFNGFLLSILISIPLITTAFSYSGLKHVSEVSIFADKSLAVTYAQARGENPTISSKIFLNRRNPYIFESLHRYFSHFSPGFLFFGDDPNARHHSAFHGNLYLFEIPLLAIGFWALLKQKSKVKYFLLSWLLISPIPAAFSQQAPHSLRSMSMLLPLTIISALGIAQLFKNLILRIIVVIAVAVFFINYLYSYYVVYPLRDSAAWAYGYQQIYQSLSKIENNYDRIIVTGFYWKPYIYYLYFNKIDPGIYQSNPDLESIGKYRFGTTYWDSGGKNLDDAQINKLKWQKTLLVISPQELQGLKDKSRFELLQSIYDYSNTKEVFLIGNWR